ncbi:hypothetical protein [Roseibium alexandrii]|uniref:DUF2178 domain-containing protein n=1 Tax=Roseibium alexandrii (strain DSM 17067 / NCIMB 14079 / DFL-11) TaxID=244592 RepID=A0A5E8UXF9_ROSAD|nr:hypothetical protein [Roseibium alexandrii]RMX61801.1 hypothetical protein SADFL11_00022390 [Roseibium alexandrii DFL-11]
MDKTASIPAPLSKSDFGFSILVASGVYVFLFDIKAFEFTTAFSVLLLSLLWVAILRVLNRYAVMIEKLEEARSDREWISLLKAYSYRALTAAFLAISILMFMAIKSDSYDLISKIGPAALLLFVCLFFLDHFLFGPYRKAPRLERAKASKPKN